MKKKRKKKKMNTKAVVMLILRNLTLKLYQKMQVYKSQFPLYLFKKHHFFSR